MEITKKIIFALSTISIIAGIIYMYANGFFSDEAKLAEFMQQFSFSWILLFIVIVTSVVVPVLPTTLLFVVSIMLFGPVPGFFINYLAVCTGSIINFLVSRVYGKEVAVKMIGLRYYNKFKDKLLDTIGFENGFKIMMFTPVAPDDILCYLAGLTKMSFAKFSLIVLSAKPFNVFLYSFVTSIFAKSIV